MRFIVGMVVLFALLASPAQSQEWLGAYDADPSYYEETDHHSDRFVFLTDQMYSAKHRDNFANYIVGKPTPGVRYHVTRDFILFEHYFHDHSYTVDGHKLTIDCWYDYGDYSKPGGGRRIVNHVSGVFNEDYTEIDIDGEIFYRVSDRHKAPMW